MQVQALGHVVLKVRDLQRSEVFYSGILGMRVISRISDPRMTFFTLETPGNHHDFALMELGSVASTPADDATGLAHVAFKVGSSAEEFRLARSVLETSGTPVLYEARAELLAGACTSSIRTGTRSSCTSTPKQMWHCPVRTGAVSGHSRCQPFRDYELSTSSAISKKLTVGATPYNPVTLSLESRR